MYEIQLFPVDGGWGYYVSQNGAQTHRQPYDPDEPGFVSMNKRRAKAAAQILIDRLMAADAPVPAFEEPALFAPVLIETA